MDMPDIRSDLIPDRRSTIEPQKVLADYKRLFGNVTPQKAHNLLDTTIGTLVRERKPLCAMKEELAKTVEKHNQYLEDAHSARMTISYIAIIATIVVLIYWTLS